MSQAGLSRSVAPIQNSYPITPYVVGPSGQAGYQTIQAGIDAAFAGGGGMVFVQKGVYTENLIFPPGIQLFGDSEQGTFIVGTHTPPSSGTLNINRVTFQSATNIFSSVAAGTCVFIMEDTTVQVTNGYTFNLPNWTSPGQIQCFNIGPGGTNDGFINNTGGTNVAIFSAGVGNGSANPMIVSGITIIGPGTTIGCPVNLVTGANFSSTNNQYFATFTFSNNATGSFYNDSFVTGATPCIVQSSTGTITFSNVSFASSNNPVIDGAGAGIITFGNINFASTGSNVANTLTTNYFSSLTGSLTLGGDFHLNPSGPSILFGSVPPVIAASLNSLYINTTGNTPTTRVYVNTDGNTSWTFLTAGA